MNTYLKELEIALAHFEHVAYAIEHTAACSWGEGVLSQKSPEAMTPEERKLAIELSFLCGNRKLWKELLQLDKNDTTHV